jgi:hypothetical protein
MSSDLDRQAAVIARAATDLDQWAAEWAERWPEDTLTPLGMGDLAIDLRALLPQPEPTCPNCGHLDADHAREDGQIGCIFHAIVTDPRCDCMFTRNALPQVRALLAAERDATPARPEPRVWNAGDPEPGPDVQYVRDSENDVWTRYGNGWDIPGCADMRLWAALLAHFGPLTEAPGGAR